MEIILITLATLVAMGNSEKLCSGASYGREMNSKLECGVFKTLAISYLDCHKLCTATLKCFSTNIYKADNGTEMCDLIKGTRKSFDSDQCFVKRDGNDYNELVTSQSCSSKQQCTANPARKALPHGWYQLGSSAFKHFTVKKTMQDAKITCEANDGSLVRFDSELEKQFVYSLLEESKDLNVDEKIKELKPWKHWPLDGKDPDVILHGGATYQSDEMATTVLDLPGTEGSYATTPALPNIRISNFTLSMWVKMPDSSDLSFSSWGNPHQFTLSSSYFSTRKSNHQMSSFFEISKLSSSSDVKWMHVVGVWKKFVVSAVGELFHDGTSVGARTCSNGDKGFNMPGSSLIKFFDIGMQRAPVVHFKGRVRDIVAFNRPLSAAEVNVLKDASDRRLQRALWLATPPANANIQFSPDLNSGCVVAGAWGKEYPWLKVSCESKMEFVCKKAV